MKWFDSDQRPCGDQRLSEYLDGTLDPEAHREVEALLESSGECRRVLEELRAVVEGAAQLEELQPDRDLWGGIAATIQAPAPVGGDDEVKVIALPVAPVEEERTGVRLSRPQLIAASVALIAVSSLVTAQVGPSWGVGAVSEAEPVAAPVDVAFVDRTVAPPPPEIAGELSELERALTEARGILDPNTIRVIERNLGVIEQAIADSHRALELDPGNEYLTEHLSRVYERKLTYLRDAANVAEWSS